MEIVRYSSEMKVRWDEFAATCRQATFLMQRDYMEYHAHRFTDCSLMAIEDGKVIAALPANLSDDELYSHGGLTYGGWLTPVYGFDGTDMLCVMQQAAQWMRTAGIKALHYKPVPWIYTSCPAQDDIYALVQMGANIEACLLSAAIDLRDANAPKFNENSRRNLRKALAANLAVEDSHDFAAYWQLLEQVLDERHSARPVHTLEEITRLAELFPANISLTVVRNAQGALLAGAVMYLTTNVAHAQYIASSTQGRQCGALALLFSTLRERYAASHRWLDLGTSNEDGGRVLNAGLIHQKQGFGARAVACPTLKLTL